MYLFSSGLKLLVASPIDGCKPYSFDSNSNAVASTDVIIDGNVVNSDISNNKSDTSKPRNEKFFAVYVHRGKCRFDVKAKHAQAAGAQVLIVGEIDDLPLQRIGGIAPDAGAKLSVWTTYKNAAL